MAWIKVEHATPDKPEVDALAELLDWHPDRVVGTLIRLWRWADQQTITGNAPGVTRNTIDRHARAPGFAHAMEKVGWLEVEEGGVTFPRFDRHNGQTAKARALTADRVVRHRAQKRNAAGVTSALPEKRREEKKKTTPPTPQNSRNQKAKTTAAGGAAECQLVVDYWNEHRGKPRVATLTAARRAKLGARFAEPDFIRSWQVAINRIGQAPEGSFLNGGGDRGWRADFDWFIRNDTNYVRVLEGWGADSPKKPRSEAGRVRSRNGRYDKPSRILN